MKKLLKVILILLGLVLIGLIGLFFVPDEDLSPEAIVLLEPSVDPDPEMNIYHALLGFGVAEDKDFVQEGIRISQETNKALKNYYKSVDWREGSTSELDSISLLAKPVLKATFIQKQLCIPSKQQCIEFWRNNQAMLEKLMHDNEILMNRYYQIRNMTHFVNTMLPDSLASSPPYSDFANIGRLYLAHTAAKFINTHEPKYLELIYDELEFYRLRMVQADDLIEKVIALAFVRDSVFILSELLEMPGAREELIALPQLSGKELSLRKVIRRDFWMNESLARQLSVDPKNTDESPVQKKQFWPMPFKQNHYLNHWAILAQRIAMESELSSEEYFLEKNKGENKKMNFFDYIINPVGAIIFEAQPNFDMYMNTHRGVDGLVTLYNLKLAILNEGVTLENVDVFLESHSDQFYSPFRDQPIKYDVEKQELSFISPNQKSRSNKLHIEFH